MKSLWFRVIPVLACLFIASSCHSAGKLGGVLVGLTEYRPTTLDTQATLSLRFNNENVFPLGISKTTGKLYLNDTYIGHFEIKNAIGVPRLSAVNQTAVLFIENTAYIRQLRSSASATSIAYRLEILLTLDISEERTEIKTKSSGQIDAASLSAKPADEHKN